MLAQKHFAAKMENMLENQTDQREAFILISLLFIFFISTSKSNFTGAPDFSKDSKTTKSRIKSILDYFCVATTTTAQTCSMGSSKAAILAETC